MLKMVRDEVFTNPDLLLRIKSYVGCESITNWCLTSKNWCDKVFGNNELRIEVARCIMTRINDNLRALRDMMQDEIARDNAMQNEMEDDDDQEDDDGEEDDDEQIDDDDQQDDDNDDEEKKNDDDKIEFDNDGWTNKPHRPLWIEIGNTDYSTFFTVEIMFSVNPNDEVTKTNNPVKNFLEKNPMFKPTVLNTGKLLALLYNVGIRKEEIRMYFWEQYAQVFIPFDQKISIYDLWALPFSRVVDFEDSEIQTSLTPVKNLNVNKFPFDELLKRDLLMPSAT